MSAFTIQDIVRGTQGALLGGDLGVPVSGVSIDTRTLGAGDAFFAIRGHQLDGHAYLREAAARGASCLVVHAVSDELPPSVPAVLVDDTTKALGRFAAWHRARFVLPVAAVTGSNGKTTTKEMMAAVLGALGPVLKPESSFNNQWGLPLTLLKLGSGHRAVALELGANQPGEIAALARISQPTIGVVTVVSAAHTEFFGSLDGVQAEKSALVRAIPPEGFVVLNADDPRVLAMRAVSRGRVVTVSARGAGDVRCLGEPREAAGGVSFTLAVNGARRETRLRFAGVHNVINALAAAGVGLAIGLGLGRIAEGLEAARPVKGRCIWRRAGSVTILDDTYNANPASLVAALETLETATAARRRVVVLGDMLELGDIAEQAHHEAGRAVAASGAAEFIGVGRHARAAVEAARQAGLADSHHTSTFEDTVALLLKRLAPGDALLVKGSRGMRMERVVDALIGRFGGGDG
ncbi:MAG TPA: UDP-N-acetylmuramoyl-tripeptide--D-alanyl-D-alanine ligase [Methylomirabilota bacterium]|jgi:UDP-N-acetylmuramoyl-tripeptide--D-alanyl-D-alanine ligase|nr:UDP-N-acetylmuramoyl-tripeptide--D-alanyl-D-alanine ligase [Methylomirabilota bacterium]